jgi:hypothetical protein
VNGFIDHLYTSLGTTSNYSAIANLHTLQITAPNTESSPACSVSTSRSLVTACNSGDSSASRTQVFLPQLTVQNSCQLSTLFSVPCRAQLHCQPSTDSLLIFNCRFSTDFQLLTQLAWGPHYVASGRTQQKTPVPAILPLLGVVAETCLPSRCLAVVVSSGFTTPAFRGVMSRY